MALNKLPESSAVANGRLCSTQKVAKSSSAFLTFGPNQKLQNLLFIQLTFFALLSFRRILCSLE